MNNEDRLNLPEFDYNRLFNEDIDYKSIFQCKDNHVESEYTTTHKINNFQFYLNDINIILNNNIEKANQIITLLDNIINNLL